MVVEGYTATHYHGNDGLGDADLDIAVSSDQVQKEHAVSAIIRLVNENPGRAAFHYFKSADVKASNKDDVGVISYFSYCDHRKTMVKHIKKHN
jgi:hypothetical protein